MILAIFAKTVGRVMAGHSALTLTPLEAQRRQRLDNSNRISAVEIETLFKGQYINVNVLSSYEGVVIKLEDESDIRAFTHMLRVVDEMS